MKIFVLIDRNETAIYVSAYITLQKALEGFKRALTHYRDNHGWKLNVDAEDDSELYEISDGECTLCIDECELEEPGGKK